MAINIISYGGGQNSTAMIIEMHNRKMPIDEIIFACVGNEMPETDEFLPKFQEWCRIKAIKFTIVKSDLGSVKEYYEEKKIIPYRMFRHCTDKFKVRPINKYIRDKYGLKTPVNMWMGIGSDEAHRKDKIKGRQQFTYKFPLIEWDIDREKCVEIIKREGMDVPVKSGCWFCPFQPQSAWRSLLKNHPDLFDESIAFEKNCSAYPQSTLMGSKKLEDFKKAIQSQKDLDNFEEDITIGQCAFCHT